MKTLFKKENGFTLLETLVAFSIFVISLGVLLQIYSKGSKAALLGEQYAIATMIAQSKLSNVYYLNDFNSNNNSGEENNTYQWTTTIEPVLDDHPELETTHRVIKHKIEVEVIWGNEKKSHSVKLVSMKLLPTNET